VKPLVKHSVLEVLDIRVGTIVMVEDIPQSAKLVRLTVDFGDHRRRIIAGLKQERENPKEIETPCLTVPERPVPNGARAG